MTREEKLISAMIVAFAIMCFLSLGHCKEKDTALWLARSCAGEAGFKATETGECQAIWWIYKKRAELSGSTTHYVCMNYSAALKTNNQKWVGFLNRDGTRPAHWPKHPKWSNYKADWIKMLGTADAFLKGQVSDPRPSALHYGGNMDRNLDLKIWEALPRLLHRNTFYRQRRRETEKN